MMKKMSDSLIYSQLSEDSWISISHGYRSKDSVPVKSFVRLSRVV